MLFLTSMNLCGVNFGGVICGAATPSPAAARSCKVSSNVTVILRIVVPAHNISCPFVVSLVFAVLLVLLPSLLTLPTSPQPGRSHQWCQVFLYQFFPFFFSSPFSLFPPLFLFFFPSFSLPSFSFSLSFPSFSPLFLFPPFFLFLLSPLVKKLRVAAWLESVDQLLALRLHRFYDM